MVNRGDLIRHLEKHGCEFARDGKKHSIYVNTKNPEKVSAVPRHSPVKMPTVWKICREPGIPKPASR